MVFVAAEFQPVVGSHKADGRCAPEKLTAVHSNLDNPSTVYSDVYTED